MTDKLYSQVRIYRRDLMTLNVLRLYYTEREKQHCDFSDVIRFMLRDFAKDKLIERLERVLSG